MLSWHDISCYHKTLLVSTEGLEFVIIFCKFCNNPGFATHSKENKIVFDPATFQSSTKYRCVITCSSCKRQVEAFPHGNEALVLDFVLDNCKPHHSLRHNELISEDKIHEPVTISEDTCDPIPQYNSDPISDLLNSLTN